MKRPEAVWKDKWEKREKVLEKENLCFFPLWDYEYELMFGILQAENAVRPGKTCMETGSGTGRLSLRLAENGASSLLLDVSKEAIVFSKRLATLRHVEADFIVGSILNLPFVSSCLDFVWNGGVLEHFMPEDQERIIHEALKVLKPGGKFIAIVPNKRALLYNSFRILSMKIKMWPFGYEEPLSIEDFRKFAPKPQKFYSSGWLFCQLSHIFLPVITLIIHKSLEFLEGLLKSNLVKIEKSRPGFLLAAVWVK